MDIMSFVKPELVILVPVLYLVGVGIKKSKAPDKYIPTILGCISVSLCLLWVVATSEINTFKDVLYALFTAVTQGILTAGAGVYINQLYIQSKKDE